MVSVQELAVSLTIEENSSVGKFKKLLEKLLGREGKKIVKAFEGGGIGGGISSRDLIKIRRDLKRLVPITNELSKENVIRRATGLITQLGDIKDVDLKRRVAGKRSSNLAKIAENLGFNSNQVDEAIKDLRSKINIALRIIGSGAFPDLDKAHSLMNTIQMILQRGEQKGGRALSLLTEFLDRIPNVNKMVERIIKRVPEIEALFGKNSEKIATINQNLIDEIKEKRKKAGKDVSGWKEDLENIIKEITNDLEEGMDLFNRNKRLIFTLRREYKKLDKNLFSLKGFMEVMEKFQRNTKEYEKYAEPIEQFTKATRRGGIASIFRDDKVAQLLIEYYGVDEPSQAAHKYAQDVFELDWEEAKKVGMNKLIDLVDENLFKKYEDPLKMEEGEKRQELLKEILGDPLREKLTKPFRELLKEKEGDVMSFSEIMEEIRKEPKWVTKKFPAIRSYLALWLKDILKEVKDEDVKERVKGIPGFLVDSMRDYLEEQNKDLKAHDKEILDKRFGDLGMIVTKGADKLSEELGLIKDSVKAWIPLSFRTTPGAEPTIQEKRRATVAGERLMVFAGTQVEEEMLKKQKDYITNIVFDLKSLYEKMAGTTTKEEMQELLEQYQQEELPAVIDKISELFGEVDYSLGEIYDEQKGNLIPQFKEALDELRELRKNSNENFTEILRHLKARGIISVESEKTKQKLPGEF